ncbi:hypothetical protein AVEN_213254-1 [Araneus ventricosus]|uniref:Uncharacterized protein n=1 Tax=Araneus ventricosus TaxID=182803 RepID=A0A4Y2DH49_ARAVE|nr:hypothetical protein AVEN_213254-1 [Araneus ventricosus]
MNAIIIHTYADIIRERKSGFVKYKQSTSDLVGEGMAEEHETEEGGHGPYIPSVLSSRIIQKLLDRYAVLQRIAPCNRVADCLRFPWFSST